MARSQTGNTQNVPIHTSDSDDNLEQFIMMTYEEFRLETFSTWPINSPVQPESLAKDGFYALGNGDRVKCAFCDLVLKSWERGDSVRQEHVKFSPNCPLVRNHASNNVPLEVLRSPPYFPKYAAEGTRLQSYRNWPDYAKQKPPQLAAAGFFYTGHIDNVKCFHCGVSLRNWEQADIPLDEHIRWFPECSFALETRKSERTVKAFELIKNNGVINRVLRMGFTEGQVLDFLTQNLESHEKYKDLSTLTEELHKFSTQELSEGVQNIGMNVQPQQRGHNVTITGASNIQVPTSIQVQTPGNTGNTIVPGGGWSEEEEAKEKLLCKVCMEREVQETFNPCNHLVCCSLCAKKLRECPVCRTRIRGIVRTYLS
ncbi:hypothetical protein ScPMuIL_012428 [Solemya velum]